MITRPANRILAVCVCFALATLLLSCVTLPWEVSQGAGAQSIPRWVCPTPTPKPYGEAGPIKGYRDGAPDPTTGIPPQVPEYYVIWEQEYGKLGNPPPAPTPYTKSGRGFYLGQIINLSSSLDVQAQVRKTDVVSGSFRLYEARLTWSNRGEPFAFVPARQVVISAVQRPDGARMGGSGWSWSRDAARLAGQADDPAVMQGSVPAGDTRTLVPILAPDGEVQTLDLRLDLTGQAGDKESGGLRVQWARAHQPNCDQDGTIAASYNDPARPAQGLPPPADATDVVAFAYGQIGRPYCWGGKGWEPCSGLGVTPSCDAQGGEPCWDCSGLTWGAYKSVGVTIGHGASNQSRYPVVWQAGDSVDPANVAQQGDLLLFTGANANGRPAGTITHVGLYAGDGLMIHAANYPDGVIATPNVFRNRYYGVRLEVITRPPRK